MTDMRAFIEVGPKMRGQLKRAVEALIDLLDLLDADPDVEDGGDDELTGDEEPALGAATGMYQGHAWNVSTDQSGEEEPSLGWVGIGLGCPGLALPGYADDRELVNEHGGGDDNADTLEPRS